MALFRKLFYHKPPEGLLEISDRVYVFDCCFTTGTREQDKDYKEYIGGIISQLKDHFPDASFLVFNFHPLEIQSLMSKIVSEYDMTIMDYPCNYQGCPLLPMELINHFLRSTESWFTLQPQNVLLMHCERGGWAVLAFMLASLLLYRKQYTGEQRTLDMVYKQAPKELLPFHSQLNPIPSQLRYLQYVARRNVASEWPPLDRALNLGCVIMRLIPNFDGGGGCRPFFRVYGQDPVGADDRESKLLFSTTKNSKAVRSYKQAESEIIKIDVNCNIQGDVVLECFHLHDDMEREETMFRVMFNTAFIRSNILMLNRDEVDTLWHTKDYFPKDFRAEILFSDMDGVAPVVAAISSCFEEKEGLPVEAFAKVQEFFSHVDWLDSRADAALNVLQKISESHSSEKSDEAKEESADGRQGQKHTTVPSKLADKVQFLASDANKREQKVEQHKTEALGHPDKSFHTTKGPADSSQIMKDIGMKIKDVIESNDSKLKSSSTNKMKEFCDTIAKDSLQSSTPPQSPIIKNSQSKIQPPPPPQPPSPPSKSTSSVSEKSTPQPPLPLKSTNSVSAKSTPPPPPPSSAPPPPPLPSSAPSAPPPPPPPSLAPSAPPPPPPPSLAPSAPPPPLPPSSAPSAPPPPPLPSSASSASPPPPPPSSASSASPPPPPPSSTPSAPPPPPPPSSTPSAPPPPPPPSSAPSAPPPPPPPSSTPSAPPPPPPPSSASSAPPPPPPSLNKGVIKPGNACIPEPPSSLKSRGPQRSLGQKNSQAKKLKPLHWMKLNRAVKGSLWAETQKSGETPVAPEIDMSELESLFSASAPPSSSGTSGGKPNVAQPKADKVQLVDTRRACNCEIMLSKVKVPTNELMSVVLTLEESAMDADQVDNLVKFCPTKEEMDLLKSYNGEREKLGKCEQFFLTLMQVPRVETKLRVYSFKIQFRTQVSDLKRNLDVVSSASDQIRSSAKLKRIMQTILSLGNALNQGTARGSAIGFRLDSLLKLNETRARNNKMTLMNYLCKVINEKLPDVLDFSKDLTSVEPASKVQIKILAEEMQSISKGLEKVVQEFSSSENDGSASIVFRKSLMEFINFAEAEVKSLASLYSEVGRNVDALITYFGEDPARCSFEQVVSTLFNFTTTFNRAHEQNCKQLELENKKVEKELGKHK